MESYKNDRAGEALGAPWQMSLNDFDPSVWERRRARQGGELGIRESPQGPVRADRVAREWFDA
jgi:hypothetical protein